MKMEVIEGKCRGCAMCVSIDPEIMEMGKNGKAECTCEITGSHTDKAQLIARVCPVKAVHIMV